MQTLRDALRDLPDAVFADFLERDDAYLLVIDLPGATAETTDVRMENGRLKVEASRTKDVPDDYTYYDENRALFLDVDLPLPPDANGEDATATVERGVLELTLPRRSSTETTIPIDGE